jgi:predicted nucleotidyltransferase
MIHADLAKASQQLEIKLPALEKAAKESEQTIKDFKNELNDFLGKEFLSKHKEDLKRTDVILLGSIARRESTVTSDCDYYILQHGVSPEVTRKLIEAAESARERLSIEKPSRQGMFGKIVIAANLYESIGLEIDTNTNMTQRILLLAESEAVTVGKTYNEVIDNILRRYCSDYSPTNQKKECPVKVPRYLLNDLVRYWRTMAVDFGTKRWETSKDETNVRLAKLMITRKILFAGPLATLLLVPKKVEKNEKLHEYLIESFKPSPLTQLAGTVDLLNETSKTALKNLLRSYDEFIKIISSKEEKRILEGHGEGKGQKSETWEKCKKLGDTTQKSLEAIFCDDELFKGNFRKYGVF